MIAAWCFFLGAILGGMISPYLIAMAHDLERRIIERHRSQPLDCVRLPSYVNPWTGRREVLMRERE